MKTTLSGSKMSMAGLVVTSAKGSPRIAIGFFGLARSLTWTLPSIQQHVLEPAEQLGETRLFAHLYQQTHISNPRSGENNVLDPDEYKRLNCDEVLLEAPGECLKDADYEWILSQGDAFDDGGKSLSNLIHQLHSLDRLGDMIERWSPDIVVLIRPDLQYHDSLGPLIKKHIHLSPEAISVPDWQWYGGVNDRFAICGSEAYKAYAHRIRLIPSYLKKTGGPLPAERFLRFCLNQHGLCPEAVHVRASRIRANGQKVDENFQVISKSKLIRRALESRVYRIKHYFSGRPETN